ncbi:hypothetical protein [uncultured Pseudonocardia sp.]|uniref:hypothetical protein n=1 Tax=uncultured Pseudonocardia sp. TaxID=211455 RepID=UPI00263988F6|nr:hypothetical protein [uncultured Pseudonocardia sp.]
MTTIPFTHLPEPEPPAAPPLNGAAALPASPGTRSRARASRPPRGWAAAWLVNVDWFWFVVLLVLDGLVLALVSVADLFFVKSALDPLLGAAETVSWLVAVALAVLGVVAPVQAGRSARVHLATGHDGAIAIALVAVWALLGVGLFVLRWKAGDLTVTVHYEGDTGSADDAAAQGHHLMAIVLATLHAATGVTAFVSGYHLTNPVAFALRTARWAHTRVQRRLGPAEALFQRVVWNLGARVSDMAEAEQSAATARRVRQAVAAHVQAVARARIAQHLGDPSATGVTGPQPGDLLPR